MTTSDRARITPAIMLLLAAFGPTRASASSIAPAYSATDLGASYNLLTNAGGQVYGVANSDGSVTYAFDKSPVTTLNQWTAGGDHSDDFTLITLGSGPFQVGYRYDFASDLPGGGVSYPSFGAATGGWYVIGPDGGPVSDINIHGQVVGRGQIPWSSGFFAAFSDVNEGYRGNGSYNDNLNNYIIPIPGVTLTSAVKIDDLGRILAWGSDGDAYLVTPLSLGSPQAVPEPTTLALLTISLAGAAIRRRLRR